MEKWQSVPSKHGQAEKLEVYGSNSTAAYRQFCIKAMAAALWISSIRVWTRRSFRFHQDERASERGARKHGKVSLCRSCYCSANSIGRGFNALENGTEMDSQQPTTLFLLASKIERPSHRSELTRLRPFVHYSMSGRLSGIAQSLPPDTIEQRTEFFSTTSQTKRLRGSAKGPVSLGLRCRATCLHR